MSLLGGRKRIQDKFSEGILWVFRSAMVEMGFCVLILAKVGESTILFFSLK
jgi:hypothetical protein